MFIVSDLSNFHVIFLVKCRFEGFEYVSCRSCESHIAMLDPLENGKFLVYLPSCHITFNLLWSASMRTFDVVPPVSIAPWAQCCGERSRTLDCGKNMVF